MYTSIYSNLLHVLTVEALEGYLWIQGYWPKPERDKGYFCRYLKGHGILGSILGILGYNAF